MSVVSGTVAFAHLDKHEMYDGRSTEKYSITVVLDEDSASKLEAEGVKVKEYKNQPQRKFTTKFDEFAVIDNDGEPVRKDSVRYGDKVRVKYNLSAPHPVHGTGVYLQAVRVVEKGEVDVDSDF